MDPCRGQDIPGDGTRRSGLLDAQPVPVEMHEGNDAVAADRKLLSMPPHATAATPYALDLDGVRILVGLGN